MKSILFVDDDKKYLEIISEVLRENDYNVDTAINSYEGITLAKAKDYDIYILDLYIDDFQGVQVGEIIRMKKSNALVIYISNSTDMTDELKCLRMGGSDFISKHTSIDIFLERVKKVIDNRYHPQPETVIRSNNEQIEIDIGKRFVTKDGEHVHLTNTEFMLLSLLLSNKNSIISREKIIQDIWQVSFDEAVIEPRTIDSHIKNIKKKLDTNSIISVRGVGYRWYER